MDRPHWHVLLASIYLLSLSHVSAAPWTSEDVDVPLWSTYRPHELMSVRARVPHSPAFGFMYYPARDGVAALRHLASDQENSIRTYGFSRHDAKSFADHTIQDKGIGCAVDFSFVRHTDASGWTIRISGKAMDASQITTDPVSVVFYASAFPEELDPPTRSQIEQNKAGDSGSLSISRLSALSSNGIRGDCLLEGKSEALGGAYEVTVMSPRVGALPSRTRSPSLAGTSSRMLRRTRSEAELKTSDLSRFHVATPARHGDVSFADEELKKALSKADEVTGTIDPSQEGGSGMPRLKAVSTLDNDVRDDVPMVLVQRLLSVPFEMDVVLRMVEGDDSTKAGAAEEWAGQTLSDELENRRKAFDDKFDELFPLRDLGYDESDREFARVALSNVLGGIGYFYGGTVIEKDNQADLLTPRGLLTATPSRSQFPRGFLWDEGFHQLIVSRWSPELSTACISSWLDRVESEGWIPREQALGIEARERFPAHVRHLMVQRPSIANPPALYMPLRYLTRRLSQSDTGAGADQDDADLSEQAVDEDVDNSSRSITNAHDRSGRQAQTLLDATQLQKASKYLEWLLSSQKGSLPNSFRWKGRENDQRAPDGYPLTLASGLDDLPRGSDISREARHLDLHCWMTWAAGALADIYRNAGNSEEAHRLEARKDELTHAMLEHHGEHDRAQFKHMLCDFDGESSSCEESYISVLPLLLGLLDPASPRVGRILDMLEDSNSLRGVAGVRSLAPSSKFYRRGNDYWTGSVWMPFNYLTLAALKTVYGVQEGPYRDRANSLFEELKGDILSNAKREFERTGYIWENYAPDTGAGKSGRQFTGWSALIVLMYADLYDGIL